MPTISTVRGSVDSGSLGATLMHEHVFVLSPEINQNYPDILGEEGPRIDEAVERLDELKAAGIDSIVDLTVVGLGRNIPLIQKVAARTDLQIVVATGVYTYNDVPMFFSSRSRAGQPDLMSEFFVRDIEEGIAGTGVRAAILKCATDEPGVTEGVEMVLRQVAKAHRRTGAPISTHTHAAMRRGLDQQRVFEEEGVDLSRVIIGHSGDTTDIAYLEELMGRGSYIGMDRFGIDIYCPFDDRVNTVVTLCERGHADKMVLSHDAACLMDWFPGDLLKQFAPKWNYLHISNDVIPALKERGVSEEQVKQMMVENPRRIFETQGGY